MKAFLTYFFMSAIGFVVSVFIIGSIQCSNLYFLTEGGQRVDPGFDEGKIADLIRSGAEVMQTCEVGGASIELTAATVSITTISIAIVGVILGVLGAWSIRNRDARSEKK